MKKQFLFLLAGGVIAFASCNSNNGAGTGANTDSLVNARVDSLSAAMMLKNDSTINALATIKADSIVNAMKGGTASHTNTGKHTNNNTTPTPPPPTTIGNGKPRIGEQGGNGTTIGNGKPRVGEQSNPNSTTVGNGKPKMGGGK